MVQSLGIEMGRERAAYFSDQEYAAALLDTRLDALDDILANAPNAPSQSNGRPHAVASDQNGDKTKPHSRQNATNLLVVWAPFLAGLAALVALAIASRTMGP
jgi:hypothetical protein